MSKSVSLGVPAPGTGTAEALAGLVLFPSASPDMIQTLSGCSEREWQDADRLYEFFQKEGKREFIHGLHTQNRNFLGPLEKCLLVRQSDLLSSLELQIRIASSFLHDEKVILFIYNSVIEAMNDITASSLSAEEKRQFIRLAIETQSYADEILNEGMISFKVMRKARGMAFSLGDRRNAALLDVISGAFNIILPASIKGLRVQDIMRRGVKSLTELDDPELKLKAIPYLCLYYFLEGDYLKSIGNALLAAHAQESAVDALKIEKFAPIACLASAFRGELDMAESMVRSSIAMASRNGHTSRSRALSLYYAYILMQKKNFDLAYTLLAEEGHEGDIASVIKNRMLAYYYYLQGDIVSSRCAAQLATQGPTAISHIGRKFYLAPFFLELLYEYRKHGFEDFPNYILEDEVERCLSSSNRILCCIAMRIKGRLAVDRGKNDEACTWFERALLLAGEMQTPFEVAKSCFCLAECYLAGNDQEKARPLLLRARHIHERYALPPWPASLPEKIECDSSSDVQEHADSMEFLEAIVAEISSIRFSGNERQYFRVLLDTLVSCIGAETGILCLRDASGTLGAGAVFNLTQKDAAQWVESYVVLSAVEAQKPFMASSSESVPRCVLPFSTCENVRGAVCFGGALFSNVVRAFTPESMRILATVLGRDIFLNTRGQGSERQTLRQAGKSGESENMLLYRSPLIEKLLREIDSVAGTSSTILLQGETGVGKEVIARYIHECSGVSGPFVALNMSNLPEELFESELCGYEKGAFTGAVQKKTGILETAEGGTLFLDEIGDISLRMQVKLLRILQERTFMRVGGIRQLKVNFRVISATNRNLADMVHKGTYREDLFYRLSVLPFHVPPLRERPEDIMHLAQKFIDLFGRAHGKPPYILSEEDKKQLLTYAWPGNVRELRNVMERAVLLYPGHGALQLHLASLPSPQAQQMQRPEMFSSRLTLEELHRHYLEYVFELTQGKVDGKEGMAAILGISRPAVYAQLKKFGIRARFRKVAE